MDLGVLILIYRVFIISIMSSISINSNHPQHYNSVEWTTFLQEQTCTSYQYLLKIVHSRKENGHLYIERFDIINMIRFNEMATFQKMSPVLTQ